MKLSLLVITFFLTTTTGFACCAERDYRLFPVGEVNGGILFIEFDLFRNCDMGVIDQPGFEFHTSGVINLVLSSGDSLSFMRTIDTVDIVECRCSYADFYEKTKYEDLLKAMYLKALKTAKEISGYTPAQPVEISFNDSLNTSYTEESTDSSYYYLLQYDDLFSIDLDTEEIISCHPDKVSEIRVYSTTNYIVTIIRLRCHFISEEAIERNKKRFYNLETAVWKEEAQWHGIAKDYWIIESNNY